MTAAARALPRFLDHQDAERVIRAGPLRIDVAAVTATVGGVRLPLALKEFELLLALADRAGKVVTTADLVEQVWGPGQPGGAESLKVHVMRLRKRLKDAVGRDGIRTVRGLGYALDLP